MVYFFDLDMDGKVVHECAYCFGLELAKAAIARNMEARFPGKAYRILSWRAQ